MKCKHILDVNGWKECVTPAHLPFMNKLCIFTQIINYTPQSSSVAVAVAATATATQSATNKLNLPTVNKKNSNWKNEQWKWKIE